MEPHAVATSTPSDADLAEPTVVVSPEPPTQRWSVPTHAPVPVPPPRAFKSEEPIALDEPAVPDAAPASAARLEPSHEPPTLVAPPPVVPEPSAIARRAGAVPIVDDGARKLAPPSSPTSVPPPAVPRVLATPKAPARAATSDAVRVRMAGFWRRGLAMLVDLGLVSGLVFVLLRIGMGSISLASLPPRKLFLPDYIVSLLMDQPGKIFPIILFGLGVAFAYFFLFQAALGWTPAKRLLNMRVVDGRGHRIGPVRAFFRTFAYGISGAFFMMGFLWAAFDPERRAIHDVLSGSYVIVGMPEERASPIVSKPVVSAPGSTSTRRPSPSGR